MEEFNVLRIDFQNWLYSSGTCKSTGSASSYGSYLKHILPMFGVNKIENEKIDSYLKEMNADSISNGRLVEICGNIETLKKRISALNKYKSYLKETKLYPRLVSHNLEMSGSAGNKLFKEVLFSLEKFDCSDSLRARLISDIDRKGQQIKLLQKKIVEYLNTESIGDIYWSEEFKPSEIYNDSIDIYGIVNIGDEELNFVIELDQHNAEQITKKMVSRVALFSNKNLFYASVCYPAIKKHDKNESLKYFDYIKVIFENLNLNLNVEKRYAGVMIEEPKI